MIKEEQEKNAQKVIDNYLTGLPVEERVSMKHLCNIIRIINKEYPDIEGKLVSELYKKTIGL